jgi:hypothetical protein
MKPAYLVRLSLKPGEVVVATSTNVRPHWFFRGHRGFGVPGLLFMLAAIALIFLVVRLVANDGKPQ